MTSAGLARGAALALALGALAGCGDVQSRSVSPNDPGYWYTEAPRDMPAVRAPGNERTYRPLGGATY